MSTPVVGIDARKIRDFGIGRYLEGLLGGLAQGPGRFVLFTSADPSRSLPESLRTRLPADRFPERTIAAPPYSGRELLAFRGAARAFGLDAMHFPHYARGFGVGCPVVVTIHDAIHLSHAPSFAARAYASVMMRLSARRAGAVLTVSAAARDDLSRRLGIEPSRITVIPNGVDDRFAPATPDRVAEYRRRRGLPERFILCVASHRPHKNLPAAVRAFTEAALPDARLVVPARDEAAAERLAPLVDTPGAMLLTGVTDDELPNLYSAARIVLCPSRAEGFGLPALEAAACGAAVVASPIAAHREVLGEDGLFAAGTDAPELAAALGAAWTDEERLARARRGLRARAAGFSWRETAARTREAYARVIEASGRGNF